MPETTKTLSSPQTAKQERVVLLDIYRVIAAVAVMLYHYAFRGHAAGDLCKVSLPSVHDVVKYGYLGVEYFFVISGFVISYTALDTNVTKFARSRAIRLYPTFWICCTITTLFTAWLGSGRYSIDPATYLVNLTLFSKYVGVGSVDGVYWSLFVEMQFYSLVGLLVWLKCTDRLEHFAYFWLSLSAMLIVIPSYTATQLLLGQYAPLFSAGILFFLCYRQGFSISRVLGLGISFLLACHYAIDKAGMLSERYDTYLAPTVIVLTILIIYGSFIPVALRWVKSLPKAWVTLGAATYPLYLLHQNIGYMLMNSQSPTTSAWISLGIAVLVSTCLALVVCLWLEPPLTRSLRAIGTANEVQHEEPKRAA